MNYSATGKLIGAVLVGGAVSLGIGSLALATQSPRQYPVVRDSPSLEYAEDTATVRDSLRLTISPFLEGKRSFFVAPQQIICVEHLGSSGSRRVEALDADTTACPLTRFTGTDSLTGRVLAIPIDTLTSQRQKELYSAYLQEERS